MSFFSRRLFLKEQRIRQWHYGIVSIRIPSPPPPPSGHSLTNHLCWIFSWKSRSCLLDMCECPGGKQCYCEALTAYAHECERHDVIVDPKWREMTSCTGHGPPAATAAAAAAAAAAVAQRSPWFRPLQLIWPSPLNPPPSHSTRVCWGRQLSPADLYKYIHIRELALVPCPAPTTTTTTTTVTPPSHRCSRITDTVQVFSRWCCWTTPCGLLHDNPASATTNYNLLTTTKSSRPCRHWNIRPFRSCLCLASVSIVLQVLGKKNILLCTSLGLQIFIESVPLRSPTQFGSKCPTPTNGDYLKNDIINHYSKRTFSPPVSNIGHHSLTWCSVRVTLLTAFSIIFVSPYFSVDFLV